MKSRLIFSVHKMTDVFPVRLIVLILNKKKIYILNDKYLLLNRKVK